ncbi:MAG TPA: hypothetical protein VFA79_23240 [Myxococcales bacterium]|nr:hypothetical protein [Myxococcales bacterium]
MIRRALAFALLLAAAAPAAEPRRTGSVVYATRSRLYLDAGAREGLAPGQVLRGGSATCKVAEVSARYATCVGRGRPGDTFPLPSPPAALLVRRLPSPAPAQVLEQRRSVLSAAAFEKIEYHAVPGPPPSSHTVEVGIGHTSWVSSGAGPWHREQLDARLMGTPVGGGFTLDVDLSARRWTRRTDPISFRPDDPTQLYVWEAALSRRSVSGGPAFSLGRVRPWWMPGQSILDGGQAGWRTSGGTEAGVFAGVIPDAVTLAPSLGQGTFGGYWSGLHTGDAGSIVRFFRHELRVAFVNTADLGRRIEGEGLIEARITRRIDVAVDAQIGGGDHLAAGTLEAIRIDGAVRPVDGLSFNGSFRYEGLSVPELDGPGRIFSGGAADHADLSMTWEPGPQIRITVLSGLSTDLVAGLTRRWIGPELGVPRLFSDRVGVSAGYVQEGGWAPGRSAWLQFLVRPAALVQILTRLSWSRTRSIAPVDLDELGASAAIQAQLGAHVAVRLSALGRTTLNGDTALFGGASGQTGVFDAEITGQF